MQVQSLGGEDPLKEGTPVFLPEEFHGQSSLAGCSPWGHKELDTIKHICTLFQKCSTISDAQCGFCLRPVTYL